jgi:hypothetical protein
MRWLAGVGVRSKSEHVGRGYFWLREPVPW